MDKRVAVTLKCRRGGVNPGEIVALSEEEAERLIKADLAERYNVSPKAPRTDARGKATAQVSATVQK